MLLLDAPLSAVDATVAELGNVQLDRALRAFMGADVEKSGDIDVWEFGRALASLASRSLVRTAAVARLALSSRASHCACSVSASVAACSSSSHPVLKRCRAASLEARERWIARRCLARCVSRGSVG